MTQLTAPQHMVTRFAPSPTGRLHVGHGWSALMAHDMARAGGGQFRLRIEDIDGSRSRPEHVAAIVEDLRWLGVTWDGDIAVQSERLDAYDAALARLKTMGLLYPCFCTRADIQASLTAPHGPEGPVYPGTCRGLSEAEQARRIAKGAPHAWRIDMGKAVARAGDLTWTAGLFPVHLATATWTISTHLIVHGDVVLARKDAPASYHLSCTLDDAAMGVTHVLRGDDLRPVTDIHRLLQALLDLPSPVYIHHPLLVGADGRRLAKRDGSIALADLRAQGMDPQRLADDLRGNRFPVGIALASA
ncbi:tRNA glutamyl-Q(34) synthetase GluQRS [Sphingobium sp. KCTC 72723]|uniref:tRNA glutamyl-Q(34) synthetase GluQRS n=1 Tax=Sphingobium sp. KCTC 72723 TaxID=2733867 RepID=UPI00165E1B83|nr:tRNA glutamyl-Q(34) synthetase GluQRS [Sphingobium sp. KCTC 72723]